MDIFWHDFLRRALIVAIPIVAVLVWSATNRRKARRDKQISKTLRQSSEG